MRKTEPQHHQAQPQPAARQGGGAALASPKGEQIAQLEAMMDSSPQAEKLGGLAAMMNNSPAMTAQRKLFDSIHNSPRQVAQKKAFDAIHNSPLQTAQRKKFDSLFGTAQRIGDEEPLQGKFETVQRATEEEPLQHKLASDSPAQLAPAEKKPNNTGLPDNLKSGIENLSGMSMDNVKVHYNSSQPAQLNALAYAQGTDIHVAPGQEQHLPHEAWHVVQQAQGRVQPTMQMKGGVPVNDDKGLEHEADVMGAKAAVQRSPSSIKSDPIDSFNGREPIQRYTEDEEGHKISDNKKFAVKNEGTPESELYVEEGGEPVKLKEEAEVKFVQAGSKVISGTNMNKFKHELKMSDEELKKIHCGDFSQKLTGRREDVENETAQPGRSLFVDNINWEEGISKGNWDNHYAPVIVEDGDDRGTFETAVHVDHAWFGIYGKSRKQSFRLKTVVADIRLARARGRIDEKTETALLDAIRLYTETGSTEVEDKHLEGELMKIEQSWQDTPDIDRKEKEEKERRRKGSENEGKLWGNLLNNEMTAEDVYKIAAIDFNSSSSIRSSLLHSFIAQLDKLEGEQKSLVQQKITKCLSLAEGGSGKSSTGGMGLTTKVLIATALIAAGIIGWIHYKNKKK